MLPSTNNNNNINEDTLLMEKKERENTISESNSDNELLDLDNEINSIHSFDQGKEDAFNFDSKIGKALLESKINDRIKSKEPVTQITNYNNSALVNINYNIYLNSKKEEPTKNVNESSNKRSHHKNEIYSYLLEELNELETIIQSAKSELLNYNSNPSKSN